MDPPCITQKPKPSLWNWTNPHYAEGRRHILNPQKLRVPIHGVALYGPCVGEISHTLLKATSSQPSDNSSPISSFSFSRLYY